MSVTYFEYPWRGSVYAVDVGSGELRVGKIVVLPDGSLVKVTVADGYFPQVEQVSSTQEEALPARLIIPEGGFDVVFDGGDWERYVILLNAAAAVNTLFTVRISMDEYEQLKSGGFDQLKEKLSVRALWLISLEQDSWNGGPSVELCRTGRCPH